MFLERLLEFVGGRGCLGSAHFNVILGVITLLDYSFLPVHLFNKCLRVVVVVLGSVEGGGDGVLPVVSGRVSTATGSSL